VHVSNVQWCLLTKSSDFNVALVGNVSHRDKFCSCSLQLVAVLRKWINMFLQCFDTKGHPACQNSRTGCHSHSDWNKLLVDFQSLYSYSRADHSTSQILTTSHVVLSQLFTEGLLRKTFVLIRPRLGLRWRFGVAVTRWSWSTQLLYIEPGYYWDGWLPLGR